MRGLWRYIGALDVQMRLPPGSPATKVSLQAGSTVPQAITAMQALHNSVKKSLLAAASHARPCTFASAGYARDGEHFNAGCLDWD